MDKTPKTTITLTDTQLDDAILALGFALSDVRKRIEHYTREGNDAMRWEWVRQRDRYELVDTKLRAARVQMMLK